MTISSHSMTIAALYHFFDFNDFEEKQPNILKYGESLSIQGTLLLASEGINGTIAGRSENLESFLDWLRREIRVPEIVIKRSYANFVPFYRFKVRLKKEIVTLGVAGIDPRKKVGQYVKPQDWNQLISDPTVRLIDTRNTYEIAVGTFKNAENPQTQSFRDFPQYVREKLADTPKDQKIAMVCTGGIRCEKATAYMLEQGYSNIYHLEGGILKYLEEIPPEESLWAGECFVFDNRVTVDHKLEKGQYDLCHACRMPLSEVDRQSPDYEKGVACPHCIQKQSSKNRQRALARQKQILLARKRKSQHIGSDKLQNNSLIRHLAS